MITDNIEKNIIPDYKIYKDKAIITGTYLGGPLVAGYFLAKNFKAFNEPDKAKKAWIYSIIFTIILFSSLFLIPDVEKVPRYLIPLTYTGIVYLLINRYQIDKINSHITIGGQFYSWWRTIAISLIGTVITILPFLAVILFSEGVTNSNMVFKNFGTLRHEISYEQNNLSVTEVDKIGDVLTTTTFFDNAQQKFIYVKKVGNAYEIHISVNPTSLNNPEVSQMFKDFRNQLQTFFPNNKIVIVYITDAIDHIVGRVE